MLSASKKLIVKKARRRQVKHDKLPSMQRVKEGIDACALSAIRRRAVKCYGETAQLCTCVCICDKYTVCKQLMLLQDCTVAQVGLSQYYQHMGYLEIISWRFGYRPKYQPETPLSA